VDAVKLFKSLVLLLLLLLLFSDSHETWHPRFMCQHASKDFQNFDFNIFGEFCKF